MIEVICLDSDNNRIDHLTQWDVDQYILIKNTGLTTAPKIHFCNSKSKEALVVNSTIIFPIAPPEHPEWATGGATIKAKIPNVLLQEGLLIMAYLYVYDSSVSDVSAKTKAIMRIPVIPRQKPSNYPYIENDDYISAEALDEMITQKMDSLESSYNETVHTIVTNFGNGSPKGVFTSASELIGKESGVYLKVSDGWVYFWDGETLSERIVKYQVSGGSVYGVSIDLSNSNPEKAVTYTDNALGMEGGSPDWDNTEIFRDIRPCLLKNGVVVGYLNKNNFGQFEDGTPADITSGDAGDVMIEIPKMGYKIAKSNNTLTVQVTREPNMEGFSYLAHTRQTEGDRDKLYIGAFLGCKIGTQLRSVVGTIVNNLSGNTGRAAAQANGEGYDMMSFYPFTLIQCLFLIKYKNLNSQSCLGMGIVGQNTEATSGTTITKGMNYGDIDDESVRVKFIGLEDIWGNFTTALDGIQRVHETYQQVPFHDYYAATDGFADIANYNLIGNYYMGSGFVSGVDGSNNGGFLQTAYSGSSTTYFCDYVESIPEASGGGSFMGVGYTTGSMSGGSTRFQSGIFSRTGYVGWHTAARLMYL